ncbi:MAG: phenylalanine--tRNA ligase subunit beta [Acidobacteriota bacterium]
MLFSRNWLAEHAPVPEDVEVLAERLTAAGFAVDSVEQIHDGEVTDYLLDIEVTTNRPDTMNHFGLAREIAVLFERSLQIPRPKITYSAERTADSAAVTIDEPQACPRYTATLIKGVKVAPSPAWLVRRLDALGLRAINNVVDVTNYVLWETGQPMHAYDLATLQGGEIRVRFANEGETLTTLDGEARELNPRVLVIADAEVPVGLAGVMGGLDSEVTDETTDVLLEAAHFAPIQARRGAKAFGLHTDASHRFERGADPEACMWAAERAAALIVDIAGGMVCDGPLDVRHDMPALPVIDVVHAKLEAYAGTAIDRAEAQRILEGLGFDLDEPNLDKDDHGWSVTPPPWRRYDFLDAYPHDVYEEVLRIIGYNTIPSRLPAIAASDGPEDPRHRVRALAQDHFAAAGYAEAINWSFLDRETDRGWPSLLGDDTEPVVLRNPLSERYEVMRRSLGGPLVEAARWNQRRGNTAVRLFELGHVFAEGRGGEGLPLEIEALAVVCGGTVGSPWQGGGSLDFYDLKGALDAFAETFGIALRYQPAERPGLIPGATAEIWLDEQCIGHIGEVDDEDLPTPLFLAELALASLSAKVETWGQVETPSRFPGITVDSTLTHALDVPWADLRTAIKTAQVTDLVSFGLKDRYRGKGVPDGAVNTTITFHYLATDRSLTQDEVNQQHTSLVETLGERFGFETS